MSFVVGWVVGTIVVIVVLAGRSGFAVHEGEGALVTSFGRLTSSQLRAPGLHFKAPWHQVHRFPTREIQEPATYGGTGQVLAWDGTPLTVEATVRYRIDPSRAEHWLFGVEHAKDHLGELFESLLRGSVASFAPQATDPTAFTRLRRDRKDFLQQLADTCTAELSHTHGVQYRGIDVSTLSPPRELEEALNAVLEAEATARSRYDQATAECEQRTVAAREGVRVAEEKARAVEHEMTTVAEALGHLEEEHTLDDYVQHRRSEILSMSKTVYVRSEA